MLRLATVILLATVSASCARSDDPSAMRVDIEKRIRPDLCGSGQFERMPVDEVSFGGIFESHEAAVAAAGQIDTSTFEVKQTAVPDTEHWVVSARYKELPTLAEFEKHKSEFEQVGGTILHSGMYSECSRTEVTSESLTMR